MKFFLMPMLFFTIYSVHAQDKTVQDLKGEADKEIKKDLADTTLHNWKKGGIYNLNLSQGSLSIGLQVAMIFLCRLIRC